jgi:hypothetical protein
MAMRARRDIQTTAAFLTIMIKNLDKDNWGKLKRVLKYLNGTKYLQLNLNMESLGMLKWYVDGSHDVHWDCKGHGGAVFTMGKARGPQEKMSIFQISPGPILSSLTQIDPNVISVKFC